VCLSCDPLRPGYYLFGETSEGSPAWAGMIADTPAAGTPKLGELLQELAGMK
jgi:subtilase family serine protease